MTLAGQGEKVNSTSSCLTADKFRRAQCGVGGGSKAAGGCSMTTIGRWSDPVEGRAFSKEDTKGKRAVFAKAMSNTNSLVMV